MPDPLPDPLLERRQRFGGTAITAGIGDASGLTAGAKGAAEAENIGQQMAYAAAQSAVSQGVNIAVGLQDKFSWQAMAASAIAAPVMNKIDKFFGTTDNQRQFNNIQAAQTSQYGFGGTLATEFLKSTTRQASTILVNRQGRMEWSSIAVDTFGNAIGNSIAGQIKYNQEQAKLKSSTPNFSYLADPDKQRPSLLSLFDDADPGNTLATTYPLRPQGTGMVEELPPEDRARTAADSRFADDMQARIKQGPYNFIGSGGPVMSPRGGVSVQGAAFINNSPVPSVPIPGETNNERPGLMDEADSWLRNHSLFSVKPYDQNNYISLYNADTFVRNTFATAGNIAPWLLSGAVDTMDALKIPPIIGGGMGILATEALLLGHEFRVGLSVANRSLSSLPEIEVNGTLVKPVDVRVGDPNKVAVIGRSMDAVEPYAGALRAQGYDVNVFSQKDLSIPTYARQQWNDLVETYGRIPEEMIPQTKMFEANQGWAELLKHENYSVINLGNPFGQTRVSPFFEMEQNILFPKGR